MKRETIITTGAWPHKALWNQQRLKRRLEHSFRIVKNFDFASHHSRFKNKSKHVRFYLLFNFHLQFTNKNVGSLCSDSLFRFMSLSPPQRPLCVVGRLGRKKKRARGSRWAFLSSHRPPRAFYFFDYCYFVGIPSGSLCGGERFMSCF